GKMDFADEFAVGRKDVHSIVVFISPPGGRPEVSVHIAANAIRVAGRHIHKHAAILEVRAIDDIIDADLVRVVGMFGDTGIDDVEKFFVGRKADAVGLVHVGGNDSDVACFGIEAVDNGGKFEGGFVALVIGHDAVTGVGEPDCAVGMNGEIVGSVELFALIAVHQNRDRAVRFGARYAAGVVFAGEQAALAVAKVAVAVIRRAAKNGDFVGVFEPAEHAVVRNVAEEKVAAVAEPDGAFGPARSGVKTLDGGAVHSVFCETRVNHFDGGIGIGNGIFL